MFRMAVLSGAREGASRELKGLLGNGLVSPQLGVGMGWEMKDGVSIEQGVPVVVCDGVRCVHLGARMWSWSRTMSMASQLGVASGLVRLVFLTDAYAGLRVQAED